MNVEPIKDYETPKYPEKLVVLNDPNILKKFPFRWKRNLAAFTIVSSVVLLTFSTIQKILPSGTTTTGMIAIQRTHLTEDEAQEIISAEMVKSQLYFSRPPKTIKLNLPRAMQENDNKYQFTSRLTEIRLDGTNDEKKISYEYISDEDFTFLLDDKSYAEYASEEYADEFAKEYKAARSNDVTGIFHESYKSTKELDTADLKAQVDTFILWLKAQKKI